MHGLQFAFLVAIIRISESKNHVKVPPAADRPRKTNSESDSAVIPVPFGHVYKEGFGDVGGLKAPVDFLELSLTQPFDSEEAKEMLKNSKPENIEFDHRYVHKHGFTNPRDKILKELGISDMGPAVNETQFRWYNLAELQDRNVAGLPLPRPLRTNSDTRRPVNRPPTSGKKEITHSSFIPEGIRDSTNVNFTSCDEFGSRAYFFPKDIVNLDWLPFYVWSLERHTLAKIHSFKYATKKLVSRIREIYRKFIKIDWQQPKLLYYGIGEYLLVAADKKGLFHALQLLEEPTGDVMHSLPYIQLRLKIEDPYLVMMYCTDFFATVMAVVGNEPKTDKEKLEEAETIGLKGTGWPVSRDLLYERRIEIQRREKELMSEKQKLIAPLEPVNTGELKDFE